MTLNDVTTADLRALESTLHHEIPITQAMGVTVAGADARGLRLRATLAANLNHKRTAFGGSINSLATLACWGLVQLLLKGEQATTVIQDSAIEYLLPIETDFEAIAPLPEPDALEKFREQLRRRGIARLALTSTVWAGGQCGASFRGRFVVYAHGRATKLQETM